MLRVKIEILPFGDEETKREIATLKIANIGTNHDNFANYAVVLEDENENDGERWGYIRYFPRDLGAVELVTEALDMLRDRDAA